MAGQFGDTPDPLRFEVNEDPAPVREGDTIRLINATVKRAKFHMGFYQNRRFETTRWTVEDPVLGKVWFQSTARGLYDLITDSYDQWDNHVPSGKLLSCELTVSGTDDGIIFAKRPKGIEVVEPEEEVAF